MSTEIDVSRETLVHDPRSRRGGRIEVTSRGGEPIERLDERATHGHIVGPEGRHAIEVAGGNLRVLRGPRCAYGGLIAGFGRQHQASNDANDDGGEPEHGLVPFRC